MTQKGNCFFPGWGQDQSRTRGWQLRLRGKPLYLSLPWVEANGDLHQRANTAHLPVCREAGKSIALSARLSQSASLCSLPSASPDPRSDLELRVSALFVLWAGPTALSTSCQGPALLLPAAGCVRAPVPFHCSRTSALQALGPCKDLSHAAWVRVMLLHSTDRQSDNGS